MSDYDYTKSNGDILRVRHFVDDKVLVKVEHGTGHAAGMTVHAGNAPALALAILEAAGYDDPDNPKSVPSAVRKLKRHEANRKLAAEREAEDAKVRAYLETIGRYRLNEDYRITNTDRDEYRRVRDHFASEDIVPAAVVVPRVLQHGDAFYADQAVAWRSQPLGTHGRFVFKFEGDRWHYTSEDGETVPYLGNDLSMLSRKYFPMTEVPV